MPQKNKNVRNNKLVKVQEKIEYRQERKDISRKRYPSKNRPPLQIKIACSPN